MEIQVMMPEQPQTTATALSAKSPGAEKTGTAQEAFKFTLNKTLDKAKTLDKTADKEEAGEGQADAAKTTKGEGVPFEDLISVIALPVTVAHPLVNTAAASPGIAGETTATAEDTSVANIFTVSGTTANLSVTPNNTANALAPNHLAGTGEIPSGKAVVTAATAQAANTSRLPGVQADTGQSASDPDQGKISVTEPAVFVVAQSSAHASQASLSVPQKPDAVLNPLSVPENAAQPLEVDPTSVKTGGNAQSTPNLHIEPGQTMAGGPQVVPSTPQTDQAVNLLAVQKEIADTGEESLGLIAVPVSGAEKDTGNSSDAQNAATPFFATSAGIVHQAGPEVNTPPSASENSPSLKEQVLQQIVQKASLMSDGTHQQMQIQLKPEHLGTLNVQVAVENGAVTAKFHTDNPQVKQVLEASLNQLKQDLQTQGFKVQQVDVSLAQQGMSFSEFSRRSPQFGLIKNKKAEKVASDPEEQFTGAKTSLIENYGGVQSGGVDYKV